MNRCVKVLTVISISVWVVSFPGCQKFFDSADGPSSIRVKNGTSYDYRSVEVAFASESVHFGDVPASGVTGYKKFPLAYRYGYIKLYIDGRAYVMQPIDFVGEEPLGPGNFTYLVSITDPDDQFSVTVEVEQDS